MKPGSSALVLRWTRTLRDYAHHTLSISGDRIVFREGADRLLCLLASGRQAWQREVDGSGNDSGLHHISGSVYLSSQPVFRIAVGTGAVKAHRDLGPWPALREESGALTCWSDSEGRYRVLDPETLETVWTISDPHGNVSFHDGLFCVTDRSRTLRLIEPETGDPIAELPAPFGTSQHVHFGDSICLFGERARLALDISSGQTAWSFDESPGGSVVVDPGSATGLSSTEYQVRPYVRDGVAYCSGRGLRAFDLRSGVALWGVLEPRDIFLCSPIRAGRMAVASTDNRMHVVDTESATVVATSEPLDREIHIVEIAGGDCVVVETFDPGRDSSEIHFFAPEGAAAAEVES